MNDIMHRGNFFWSSFSFLWQNKRMFFLSSLVWCGASVLMALLELFLNTGGLFLFVVPELVMRIIGVVLVVYVFAVIRKQPVVMREIIQRGLRLSLKTWWFFALVVGIMIVFHFAIPGEGVSNIFFRFFIASTLSVAFFFAPQFIADGDASVHLLVDAMRCLGRNASNFGFWYIATGVSYIVFLCLLAPLALLLIYLDSTYITVYSSMHELMHVVVNLNFIFQQSPLLAILHFLLSMAAVIVLSFWSLACFVVAPSKMYLESIKRS